MSHETHAEHQPGNREAALGKAKEIAGVILHNDELVEEGQIEEDEAELARKRASSSPAQIEESELPPR